jgi:hypothetical protein
LVRIFDFIEDSAINTNLLLGEYNPLPFILCALNDGSVLPWTAMPRHLHILCLIACFATMAGAPKNSHADAIDDNIKTLRTSDNYKSRLAATLALAKSNDTRAQSALIIALEKDSESMIRRVAAIALGRAADGASDASLTRVRAALAIAVKQDKDRRVREGATAALVQLPEPVAATKNAASTAPSKVFVHIEQAVDTTKKAEQATAMMTKTVRASVDGAGFVTAWSSGVPSKAELAKQRTQGFVVVSSIKSLDVKTVGSKIQISCSLVIRVSPWSGKDGVETWEANRSASASGSAKVISSGGAADTKSAINDCVEALADDLMRKQATPFLKKVAGPSVAVVAL